MDSGTAIKISITTTSKVGVCKVESRKGSEYSPTKLTTPIGAPGSIAKACRASNRHIPDRRLIACTFSEIQPLHASSFFSRVKEWKTTKRDQPGRPS